MYPTFASTDPAARQKIGNINFFIFIFYIVYYEILTVKFFCRHNYLLKFFETSLPAMRANNKKRLPIFARQTHIFIKAAPYRLWAISSAK